MSQKKSVYFGSGWFSPAQEKAYRQALALLKKNSSVNFQASFVPLDNPYKGIDVSKHPECLRQVEWATATYRSDLMGIKTRDVMLAVYVPGQEDVGLGMELGYALSCHKYILLVIPDEYYGKKINLMSWGACDQAIKLSELASFDFTEPSFGFYPGPVY